MRTGLEDTLAAEGFRVISAIDGERGLERALKEKPDLILLDVMMPKLDGFALCRELRRLGHTMMLSTAALRSCAIFTDERLQPFVGTLWVANPTRQSLARSRKRVLRRLQECPRRSVDS